ncbi:hypothetical protein CGH11_09490 [Vibrio parahaemolyticus]|nr:hypothetical protein CGH11_09490 [Vibrio parahaemolyticus]
MAIRHSAQAVDTVSTSRSVLVNVAAPNRFDNTKRNLAVTLHAYIERVNNEKTRWFHPYRTSSGYCNPRYFSGNCSTTFP